MNQISTSLLTCVLAFVGLISSSHGQQEPAQTNLRVLALPPRVQHAPLFLLQKKNSTIPLEVVANRLTGPYKATIQNRWRFSLSDKPAAEGENVKLAASCAALKSAAEQLVVLVKKSNSEMSYGAFAVDIGTSFKERQFLVVNLTSKEIAGDIGGKRVAFPPGEPIFVAPKDNIAKDLCHAMFLTREAQDPWKPFFSTNWPLKDKIRGLVFFYQDPSGRKILIHTVSDFL
ncbi:MAG: hypothetical protein MUF13_04385 [Akkermansiaceae bacterium]|jgi:hypothetical protein|nr:hypothetical protein [Akkermansiaceae bacterium]